MSKDPIVRRASRLPTPILHDLFDWGRIKSKVIQTHFNRKVAIPRIERNARTLVYVCTCIGKFRSLGAACHIGDYLSSRMRFILITAFRSITHKWKYKYIFSNNIEGL